MIIRIPGPPPLWRRPIPTRTRGHLVTHPETVIDERRVEVYARIASQRSPMLTGPVRLTIEAVYQRPQRRPSLVPAEVWATGQRYRHIIDPDATNMLKAVEDGLTRAGVWADDNQVCDLRGEQWVAALGEAPHTVVRVTALGWLASEIAVPPA